MWREAEQRGLVVREEGAHEGKIHEFIDAEDPEGQKLIETQHQLDQDLEKAQHKLEGFDEGQWKEQLKVLEQKILSEQRERQAHMDAQKHRYLEELNKLKVDRLTQNERAAYLSSLAQQKNQHVSDLKKDRDFVLEGKSKMGISQMLWKPGLNVQQVYDVQPLLEKYGYNTRGYYGDPEKKHLQRFFRISLMAPRVTFRP